MDQVSILGKRHGEWCRKIPEDPMLPPEESLHAHDPAIVTDFGLVFQPQPRALGKVVLEVDRQDPGKIPMKPISLLPPILIPLLSIGDFNNVNHESHLSKIGR